MRDLSIDVTKGILVFGMIFTHVIQFVSIKTGALLYIQDIGNLVTFSGFFFCFGFACYRSYFEKETTPWQRIGITVLKCYIAFVISGIAFRALVSRKGSNFETLFDIMVLNDLPGWSEFLISFAVVLLLAAVLKPAIVWLLDNPGAFIVVLVLLLATGFLPKDVKYDPRIGILIGGKGFAYFSIVQYFPLFLLGCWFAKKNWQVEIWMLIVGLIGVAGFFVLQQQEIKISRFPASTEWVLFSIAAVAVYFWLGRMVTQLKLPFLVPFFNYLGHNVLYFLLFSNIVLFALKRKTGFSYLGFWKTLALFVFILFTAWFLQQVSVGKKQSDKVLE